MKDILGKDFDEIWYRKKYRYQETRAELWEEERLTQPLLDFEVSEEFRALQRPNQTSHSSYLCQAAGSSSAREPLALATANARHGYSIAMSSQATVGNTTAQPDAKRKTQAVEVINFTDDRGFVGEHTGVDIAQHSDKLQESVGTSRWVLV